MNEIVKQYLDRADVVQINPVWEDSNLIKIVGYHYECFTEKDYREVRNKLEEIFERKKLPYSLSEEYTTEPTKKFVLYLNN